MGGDPHEVHRTAIIDFAKLEEIKNCCVTGFII